MNEVGGGIGFSSITLFACKQAPTRFRQVDGLGLPASRLLPASGRLMLCLQAEIK